MKTLLISITILFCLLTPKQVEAQEVDLGLLLNHINNNLDIKKLNVYEMIEIINILNKLKNGDKVEEEIKKFKNHEIARDTSGRLKAYNEYASDIASLLNSLNYNVKDPELKKNINSITNIFIEQKNASKLTNNNVLKDTVKTTNQRFIKDTVTEAYFKLSILIDKIKIYDYCDGRNDDNYAGEFTSEIRILKNNTPIKLYQQNNLLEKNGEEYILYNENQIPFEISSLSNSFDEIKIEAKLLEWDGDTPTELSNYESIPVNQWKNKYNEKYQDYHLMLDKNSECKAGLIFKIKLENK